MRIFSLLFLHKSIQINFIYFILIFLIKGFLKDKGLNDVKMDVEFN